MFYASPDTSAMVLIHIQPTFMPGGDLPVPDGDAIVRPTCEFLDRLRGVPIIATQEWHPPAHISFASRHPGKKPLDTIELYGHEQTLWPDHAVRGTPSALLAAALPTDRFDLIFRTATSQDTESYSVFRENWGPDGTRRPTGLAGYLRERGTHRVLLWGLALDVCVAWSARDSAKYGFETSIVVDLCRAIAPDRQSHVLASLESEGVRLVSSAEVELSRG